MALLPFRLYAQPAQIAVRDGVIFVLFVDALHVDIADAVGRLYDRYLAMVDPTSLEWIWASGSSYRRRAAAAPTFQVTRSRARAPSTRGRSRSLRSRAVKAAAASVRGA